jgi:ribosomal protein S3
MKDITIFNLKRFWHIDGTKLDLYEDIKAGRKTSEWRSASPYWLRKLLTNRLTKEGLKYVLQTRGHTPQELTTLLKVHKAWFVIGYPKGNVPRLEADITALIYHRESGQLEIKITNVKEVLA